MEVRGKCALVTGGGRGIGRAICLELAQKGADIALVYAGNTQAAEETAAACRALGVKARLDAGMTDEEAFALLATDGMLVKRPIVVGDGFVLVGFKEGEWEARLA